MTSVRYLSALAIPLVLAGCSAAPTDVPASTTTNTSSSSSTPTPATPPPGPVVPFRDYLTSIKVTAQPVPIAEAAGLEVTVPVPDGWARTNDPIFATGLEFIQPIDISGGDYPSATLMAIRLDGDFDPKEAIRHANVDALPPRATGVTESFDDYQGLPSALAQGVADGVEHLSRFVIATVPAGQRYLVQLAATGTRGQTIAQSPQLSSIVNGFTVAVK